MRHCCRFSGFSGCLTPLKAMSIGALRVKSREGQLAERAVVLCHGVPVCKDSAGCKWKAMVLHRCLGPMWARLSPGRCAHRWGSCDARYVDARYVEFRASGTQDGDGHADVAGTHRCKSRLDVGSRDERGNATAGGKPLFT